MEGHNHCHGTGTVHKTCMHKRRLKVSAESFSCLQTSCQSCCSKDVPVCHFTQVCLLILPPENLREVCIPGNTRADVDAYGPGLEQKNIQQKSIDNQTSLAGKGFTCMMKAGLGGWLPRTSSSDCCCLEGCVAGYQGPLEIGVREVRLHAGQWQRGHIGGHFPQALCLGGES